MTPQPTLTAVTDRAEKITLRPASKRVAEKAGFQLEGIQRQGCAQRCERHYPWVAAIVKGDLS